MPYLSMWDYCNIIMVNKLVKTLRASHCAIFLWASGAPNSRAALGSPHSGYATALNTSKNQRGSGIHTPDGNGRSQTIKNRKIANTIREWKVNQLMKIWLKQPTLILNKSDIVLNNKNKLLLTLGLKFSPTPSDERHYFSFALLAEGATIAWTSWTVVS